MSNNPKAIAEMKFSERTVILFDDGAAVNLNSGDADSCSVHGELTEMCEHGHDLFADVPTIEGATLAHAAASDSTIQNAVLDRLAENDHSASVIERRGGNE